MNFIEFMKKIFKTKENNINNLINISDSFIMPTRQVFKDNKEMLEQIDSYKEEYKKILSEKKLLFSMDLTNNINEDIRMYSELITNIFIKEEKIEEKIETKIKLFYKVNKLNLYKQEINRLYLECTARLISLLEIFNERKLFMPKYKKEAILFAINNLTNAILVFEAQRNAIEIEKENYLNNYTMIDINNYVYEIKRKEFIKNKIRLLNMILRVINKKVEGDDLIDILSYERELEIYAYKNKDGIISLKRDIDFYNTTKDKRKFDEFCLSASLYSLERRALLYFYYGKNLIDMDYIYKLYELKLKTLVCKNMDRESLLVDSLRLEREAYTEIVFNKLERIINGQNQEISKLFGSDSKKAISHIIEQLKTDGIFDVENILISDNLNFLFSFDSDDGYIKFLNRVQISTEFYSEFIIFYHRFFTWEKEIPITSLYEMIRLNNIMPNILGNRNRYYLYKLWQKHLDYYKLPEGITKVSISQQDDLEELAATLYQELNNSVKGKKLILPHTLESFEGNLFAKNTVKELVLNDGIKSIDVNTLDCAQSKTLIIPPSLKNVVIPSKPDGKKFYEDKYYNISDSTLTKIETIVFTNYKNSKLLKNTEGLKNLFANTLGFEDRKTGPKLKSSLKEIILIDQNEKTFIFDLSDMSFNIQAFTRVRTNRFNNMIKKREVGWCIEKIKERIEKEFEHFEKNKQLSLSKPYN